MLPTFASSYYALYVAERDSRFRLFASSDHALDVAEAG